MPWTMRTITAALCTAAICAAALSTGTHARSRPGAADALRNGTTFTFVFEAEEEGGGDAGTSGSGSSGTASGGSNGGSYGGPTVSGFAVIADADVPLGEPGAIVEIVDPETTLGVLPKTGRLPNR